MRNGRGECQHLQPARQCFAPVPSMSATAWLLIGSGRIRNFICAALNEAENAASRAANLRPARPRKGRRMTLVHTGPGVVTIDPRAPVGGVRAVMSNFDI